MKRLIWLSYFSNNINRSFIPQQKISEHSDEYFSVVYFASNNIPKLNDTNFENMLLVYEPSTYRKKHAPLKLFKYFVALLTSECTIAIVHYLLVTRFCRASLMHSKNMKEILEQNSHFQMFQFGNPIQKLQLIYHIII